MGCVKVYLTQPILFSMPPIADLVLQGNRIKIQTHYECRRHDTPAKPRVE